MKRVLVAAVLAALAVTAPALAITFGQRDDTNRYPKVGAMIVKLTDGSLIHFCSGAMVSDRVFLTAGHCTYLAEQIFGAGNYELGATFVQNLEDPSFGEDDVVMGEGFTHPGYDGKYGNPAKRVDVGLIELERNPNGASHYQLPTLDLVDSLDLRTASFTAVGYGVMRDDKTGGPHALGYDGWRRYAVQQATTRNDGWLKLSMNPSTGDGGTCGGDSGGPHLLGSGAAETKIIVSVTSHGETYCRSTDWTARVDTATVLGFINEHVAATDG